MRTYYLEKQKGREMKLCKVMFLSTLNEARLTQFFKAVKNKPTNVYLDCRPDCIHKKENTKEKAIIDHIDHN